MARQGDTYEEFTGIGEIGVIYSIYGGKECCNVIGVGDDAWRTATGLASYMRVSNIYGRLVGRGSLFKVQII